MCYVVMDLRKGLISPWALYPVTVAYLLMKNLILCTDSAWIDLDVYSVT